MRSTSSISAARLHRLVQGSGAGRQIPAQLSQTGCVNSDQSPTQPASGLIPYAPNAPFFSDGAIKARWLALPDGQRIVIGGQQRFRFPQWQRAGQELQPRHHAGRDAALHASQRRQLGWLHLRVERGRHRRHARGRRQDRAGRRANLGVPERSAVPAMPFGGGRTHARARDRPVEWRLRLSAPGARPISSPRSMASIR